MKSLLFILCFLFTLKGHTYEKADAFIIMAYDKRYKVLAPATFKKDLNVIIENKTMMPLVGKLQTLKGRVLKHLQLETKKFIAVKLIVQPHERIFFIPLSPAGQEVELIIGRKSYEIPPQR